MYYFKDSSRYPIFAENYLGQKTNDGVYSLPDCFYAEDVKRVTYTDDSNVIEKSTSYVSKFTSNLNSGSSSGGLYYTY